MSSNPKVLNVKINNRLSLAVASALSLMAFAVAAETVAPADTIVQQYVGDYPLATTESVGTFTDAQTAGYPEANVYPADTNGVGGYQTAATLDEEPRDAFYSDNVGGSGPIVTVPAAYQTQDVPVFVNPGVPASVALDNSVVSAYDAPAGYFAQFGAFGLLDNAKRLRSNLVSQLGSSVLIVSEGGLYKVQAGPFETADRAFATQTSSPEQIRVLRR